MLPTLPPKHPNAARAQTGWMGFGGVPICSLNTLHLELISRHLLSLDARDRYLRLGYFASDAFIQQYVSKIDFVRDEVFGIFDRSLQLIALAHLAVEMDTLLTAGAEFGVSVLPHARGKGFGTRLFQHAAQHAINRNRTQIFIHALSENTAMVRIVTSAGARLERYGCESDAFVQLPAPTFKGRLTAWIEEHVARADYQLKAFHWRAAALSSP